MNGPIFKVTVGLRRLKMASLYHILKGWLDFDQTCTDILSGHEKELVRFLLPSPHFQCHGGIRRLKNKNDLCAPYLLKGWIVFDHSCTGILFGYEKELIRI